jgi:hypothetical protein
MWPIFKFGSDLDCQKFQRVKMPFSKQNIFATKPVTQTLGTLAVGLEARPRF